MGPRSPCRQLRTYKPLRMFARCPSVHPRLTESRGSKPLVVFFRLFVPAWYKLPCVTHRAYELSSYSSEAVGNSRFMDHLPSSVASCVAQRPKGCEWMRKKTVNPHRSDHLGPQKLALILLVKIVSRYQVERRAYAECMIGYAAAGIYLLQSVRRCHVQLR